jgi:hypothetical protein
MLLNLENLSNSCGTINLHLVSIVFELVKDFICNCTEPHTWADPNLKFRHSWSVFITSVKLVMKYFALDATPHWYFWTPHKHSPARVWGGNNGSAIECNFLQVCVQLCRIAMTISDSIQTISFQLYCCVENVVKNIILVESIKTLNKWICTCEKN